MGHRMGRRTVIAGAGVVLSGAGGYYLLTRQPFTAETSASGPEPTVERGTQTTVTITATRTGWLALSPPRRNGVHAETDRERMEPPPDESDFLRRGGKIWLWDSPTRVKIEVLVTVAEDADTGVSQYLLLLAEEQPETREEYVVEEFSITVENE